MRLRARYLLVVAALVGCGGSANTSDRSTRADSEPENLLDGQGAGESSDGESGDAPVLGDPEKLSDVPADGETVPLHLYVSNQSFDISPVGIDIWLQETHVITGGFHVEGQHNWILFELEVPVGNHVLRAESLEGSVVLNESIRVAAERWGVLDFWYYPEDPAHPMFTWSLHETPVAFD